MELVSVRVDSVSILNSPHSRLLSNIARTGFKIYENPKFRGARCARCRHGGCACVYCHAIVHVDAGRKACHRVSVIVFTSALAGIFFLVTGIDSSATFSFTRLKQITDVEGVQVVLTGLKPGLENRLAAELLAETGGGNTQPWRVMPKLADGVAWAEAQMGWRVTRTEAVVKALQRRTNDG